MTKNFQTLSAVIESVVRELFGPGVVDRIAIAEGKDFEGDDIFLVNVIFSGKGPLDDEKTSSVIRHIRRALGEHSDERFPVVSFMSQADAAGLNAEAA